jgi:hypothetical protein
MQQVIEIFVNKLMKSLVHFVYLATLILQEFREVADAMLCLSGP